MTQLPETEVMRKELERDVVGKRIKDVTVTTAALVARHRNRPEFARVLAGRRIESVSRRGTALILGLEDGDALVVRMGSQALLSRETATAAPGRHTQVVATFTTGGALHYADVDKDGELFVVPVADLAELLDLNPGGVDPLSESFTWPMLAKRLESRHAELKETLVDEDFLVGLGDRYSDEVLWAAGLAGPRVSSSLSNQEIRRLYRALLEVLYEAVKQGNALEEPAPTGEAHDEAPSGAWKVYGREGESCPRCRQPIRRGTVGGHESYFCANCQT